MRHLPCSIASNSRSSTRIITLYRPTSRFCIRGPKTLLFLLVRQLPQQVFSLFPRYSSIFLSVLPFLQNSGSTIFYVFYCSPNFGTTPLILVNNHDKIPLAWRGAGFGWGIFMVNLIFPSDAAEWFWLWFCNGYCRCSRSRCRGSASGIGFLNKNNRRYKQKSQTNNESSPFS